MRRFAVILLVFVILIAGLVLIAPSIVPRGLIKSQIEEHVGDALGSELAIGGPVELEGWFPFRLALDDIRIDAGKTGAVGGSIDRLEIVVDTSALFSRTVRLDKLDIVRPDLVVRPVEGEAAASADAPREEESGERGERWLSPASFSLGEINITDGTIVVGDEAEGTERRFEQIGLTVSQPDGKAIVIKGSATSAGETATLDGTIADPVELVDGGSSRIDIALAAPGLDITAGGDVSGERQNATLELAAPDLRRLMAWLGVEADLPEGTLNSASLTASLAFADQRLALGDLVLGVDGIEGRGELLLALDQARPKLSGALDFGELDLRPVQPEPAPEAEAEEAAADDEAAAPAGWDDTPLDLPLPLPLDIDLPVSFESLVLRELALGAGRLEFYGDSLGSRIVIEQLELYEGSLAGTLSLDHQTPPQLTVDLKGEGLALQPLLAATAGFERLRGTGMFALDLKSKGESVRQLVAGLGGAGEVRLTDGAILGINIAAMLRQVATLGASASAAEERATDFAELGGTFTIEDGRLRNDDLMMRAPLLRLGGSGEVDLLERTLDYRIDTGLASTLEGQKASDDPVFVEAVPVLLEGPWDDIDIRFMLGDAVSRAIKDPAKVGELVGEITGDPARLGEIGEKLGLDPSKLGIGLPSGDGAAGDAADEAGEGADADGDVDVKDAIGGAVGGVLNNFLGKDDKENGNP